MAESQVILGALAPVLVIMALGIAAAIASRALGLTPILGYIALGAAAGATGLIGPTAMPGIHMLAELGVVFLLFDVGLHFSLRKVRDQAGAAFGLGFVQIAFNSIGIGALLLLATDLPLRVCLLAGAILSLSSTALVVRVIAERGQRSCPVGEAATGVLVVQDFAAILLLIVAAALAGGGSNLWFALGATLFKGVCAFLVAVLLARFGVLPLFSVIARSDNEEVFTAAALLAALSSAWATGMAGLSLTLGAFLGGMIVAETPYRPVVQSEARSFRGLLLGVFFIAIGLSLDITALRSHWLLILGATATLIVAKALLNGAAALVFRWSLPGAAQLGFLLAQGSEFALILLVVPSVRTALGKDVATVLITAVTLTLALAPLVSDAGRGIARRIRSRRPQPNNAELVPGAPTPPILIIGMGVVGRRVADALNAFDYRYSAMERDHGRFLEALADGYRVIFGDAGDPRLWDPIAMQERCMIVLSAPQMEISAPLTPLAARFFPGVKRLAIVRTGEEQAAFSAAGLEAVLDRGEARGLCGAAAVLRDLGVTESSLGAWIGRQEELERPQDGLTWLGSPIRSIPA